MNAHHTMTESKCLSCSTPLDAAKSPGSDDCPSAGDISICLYCGHVAAFNADLELIELDHEQMRFVAGNEDFLKLQQARAATFNRRDAK